MKEFDIGDTVYWLEFTGPVSSEVRSGKVVSKGRTQVAIATNDERGQLIVFVDGCDLRRTYMEAEKYG